MNRYEVTIKEIEIYTIPVEAENESDAEDIAWDLLTADADSKARYHNDSDGETSVVDAD